MTTKELFLKLLSAKSITPDDGDMIEFIDNYLSDFETIRVDKNGIKNIFLYKKFGDGKHLCFAGHLDVVPEGNGWNSEPFIPKEENGKIFARGAQDMKSGVSAFIQALKSVKTFDGTLSALLTSDEEGEAKYGTIEVLKYLKKIDFLPDFAIIAEPTCDKVFGDVIKIGRRGSINGKLTLKGIGGHAAYPEKSQNPINHIAPILPKIANIDLDYGDENFAPSRIVITDIRSGIETTNVTPGLLSMMFNVRNSNNTSLEDVEAFIKKHFLHLDYLLELSQSAKPFITNRDSKITLNLISSIEKVLGKKPDLQTTGGTSDARFFGEFDIDTVEFGVINNTIHAPNEYTDMKYVEELQEIFTNLIKFGDF